MNNKENNEEKKEITVITGDGKELEISPVYDHIKSDVAPDFEGKKDVVIPKSSSDKKNKNQ